MLQLVRHWTRDLLTVLQYVKYLPVVFITAAGAILITVSILLMEVEMRVALFLFISGVALIWHKQIIAWLTHAKRREDGQISASILAIEKLKDDPYFLARYGSGATVFESNRYGLYDAPVGPDHLVQLGIGVAYLPQPKPMGKFDAFIDRLPPQKTVIGLALVIGLFFLTLIMNSR